MAERLESKLREFHGPPEFVSEIPPNVLSVLSKEELEMALMVERQHQVIKWQTERILEINQTQRDIDIRLQPIEEMHSMLKNNWKFLGFMWSALAACGGGAVWFIIKGIAKIYGL